MPDFPWVCGKCQNANPPYTEVCRECGNPPQESLDSAIGSQAIFHWWLLTILLVVSAVGALIYEISSSSITVPIRLNKDEKAEVSVYRVLPATLQVSLKFNRPSGKAFGLGSSETRYGGDGLCFLSPGEPIKFVVQGAGQAATYEALPNSVVTGTVFQRTLVPFSESKNLNRCTWPPDNSLRPLLPSGFSTVSVTITDVGQGIVGEQVSLVIEPPVSLKATASNYRIVWFFTFWRVYALILLVYALILVLFSGLGKR
jgi:hypothetical protein